MTIEDAGLRALMSHHAQTGRVEWIGLRPARHAPLEVVSEAAADPEHGLRGDHYAGISRRSRQVTLLQAEHLPVLAALIGHPVGPELLRRNLVVARINLWALKDRRFRIGKTVVLEGTGLCHPCRRMETLLGRGGYNALRGHGGITARIVEGGALYLGDAVWPLAP